jgi:hypothetical protein
MRFFADNRTLAEELARSEPLLRQSMDRFRESQEIKQQILLEHHMGKPVTELLPRLHYALADEIALMASNKTLEKDILDEVLSLRFDEVSKEIYKLNLTLNHARSREKYVYEVMKQLYKVIQQEAATVSALQKDANRDFEQRLVIQLELEQQLMQQLQQIPDFTQFYINLALGQRLKHELDLEEQEFADEIFQRMCDARTEEDGTFLPPHRNRNSISFLTAYCFYKLEEAAVEAVEEGKLQQHTYMLYELVNSDLFEKLVSEAIKDNNLADLNDKKKIAHFIAIFRELYNTRIEEDMD